MILNILVVEDEIQLADTLAEILKRNKYQVDAVFDGAMMVLNMHAPVSMTVLFLILCFPFAAVQKLSVSCGKKKSRRRL